MKCSSRVIIGREEGPFERADDAVGADIVMIYFPASYSLAVYRKFVNNYQYIKIKLCLSSDK